MQSQTPPSFQIQTIRFGSDHKILWVAALLLITTAVPFSMVPFAAFGIRINLSASLPKGFYIRSSRGQLAEVCPPADWGKLSAERGYRPHVFMAQLCPDGAMPLLKPIVARAGDKVLVSEAGIDVNGVRLSNSTPLAYDQAGRPLTHFAFGEYTVAQHELWLISSYHPRSFDSRYFGPVSDNVIATLRPLFTF